MEKEITRKSVGYFGKQYAHYLEENNPEAWGRFCQRKDYLVLLRKYHAYCQCHMAILMEMLKAENHFGNRNDFAPGLQRDFYNGLIEYIKDMILGELIDLLQESSWMTA